MASSDDGVEIESDEDDALEVVDVVAVAEAEGYGTAPSPHLPHPPHYPNHALPSLPSLHTTPIPNQTGRVAVTEAEGAPQLTSTDSLGEVKEEEDSHCPFLLLDLSLTTLLLLTLLLTL
eukprot:scaffold48298_cov44-Phaeocystis_antarctica.AAC.2